MVKATAGYSRTPERDVALLLTLYGTAMATTELAIVTVSDFVKPDGSVKVASAVRVDVAHNGTAVLVKQEGRRSIGQIPRMEACQ